MRLQVRTLALAAVASATLACDDPGEGWPVAYAVIEGNIVRRDSSKFVGRMFINCGPDIYGQTFNTVTPGSYRFAMIQSHVGDLDKAWCEVGAGVPVFATRSDTVKFSGTRATARTTTIHVVEK